MAAREASPASPSVDFPKPIIAAVNGAALAGGLRDHALVRPGGGRGPRHLRHPRGQARARRRRGGLIRLPKRLPIAIALELALTGEPIDAARALEFGLMNRVVPADRSSWKRPWRWRSDRRQRAAGRAVVEARHGAGRGRLGGRRLEAQCRGGRGGVLLGRRHGGPDRLRREAQAELAGQVVPAVRTRP